LLVSLIGLSLAAAPLQADEGHCARPQVAATVHAHAPSHVEASPARNELSTEHGCPACPASSCAAMHGCSSAPQVSADVVVARAMLMPIHRRIVSESEAVPASVSHTPPTPPPLVLLSPA